MNKYICNSSKSCVFYTQYPKELRELHNDPHLAPDKIEIKKKMLS